MEKKEDKNLIKLGLFVIFGLFIFFAIIYILGKNRNIFTSNIKLIAIFENVYGLSEGSKVRLLGIDVGSVSKIRISSEKTVLVEMNIREDVVRFIPGNSLATIGTEGITGTKTVVIFPGTTDFPPVKSKDTLNTIRTVEIDDIIREIKNAGENITKVSENLIEITEKLNRGEGVFGKLFTDINLSNNVDKTINNFVELSNSLNQIAEIIKSGEGVLGTILVDTVFSRNLKHSGRNFEKISQNLNWAIDKLTKGEGLIGKISSDTTLLNKIYNLTNNLSEASDYLNKASKNLNKITIDVSEGQGIINRLLTDSILADSIESIVYKLNRSLDELVITAKIVQNNKLIRMFSKKNKKTVDKEVK